MWNTSLKQTPPHKHSQTMQNRQTTDICWILVPGQTDLITCTSRTTYALTDQSFSKFYNEGRKNSFIYPNGLVMDLVQQWHPCTTVSTAWHVHHSLLLTDDWPGHAELRGWQQHLAGAEIIASADTIGHFHLQALLHKKHAHKDRRGNGQPTATQVR